MHNGIPFTIKNFEIFSQDKNNPIQVRKIKEGWFSHIIIITFFIIVLILRVIFTH